MRLIRPALALTAALAATAALTACSSDSASTAADKTATAASKAGEAASSAVAGAAASMSAAAASSSAGATTTYTMAQVAEHKTPADCWTAIKAPGQTTTGVYDLTKWIGQHRGGPSPIESLCGIDGTKAFTTKHGDDGAQGEPEQMLSSFKIGTLAG